ncbi:MULTISPECIES: response regulator [Sphingomonadaceae]|uniref:response regulator n=1 Tax=Sphingomonadales TaxID=204457 RepID=UPI001A178C34|nr:MULTISPECIES: response regulator [Sphingomonadaceae]CAD7337885.1 Protein-glutamate methylesterase/protein-glutamine glutaminase [Sphingobium sp. S6]CAD7338973.1 Protein-glutamate methylesterase/protein-glutamine glutaminase [Sphingobium sp. S8]
MIRILYVDDEADLREIAVMSLELDPEIQVRTAASGAEALEQAKQWQPALILLDVMMPGMDGPATLARLRADPDTSEIPAAFITAKTHPRHVTDLKALGARAVLAKPFDPMSLAANVRTLLQP